MRLTVEYWCQDISHFSVSYSQTQFFHHWRVFLFVTCWCNPAERNYFLFHVSPASFGFYFSRWAKPQFQEQLGPRNIPELGCLCSCLLCVCVVNGKRWIAAVITSHCLVIPVPASGARVCAELRPCHTSHFLQTVFNRARRAGDVQKSIFISWICWMWTRFDWSDWF